MADKPTWIPPKIDYDLLRTYLDSPLPLFRIAEETEMHIDDVRRGLAKLRFEQRREEALKRAQVPWDGEERRKTPREFSYDLEDAGSDEGPLEEGVAEK